MTEAMKARLNAEIAEHEKTYQRMRALEKENSRLRGIVHAERCRVNTATKIIRTATTALMKAFPVRADE